MASRFVPVSEHFEPCALNLPNDFQPFSEFNDNMSKSAWRGRCPTLTIQSET